MIPITNVTAITTKTPNTKHTSPATNAHIGTKAIFIQCPNPHPWPTTPFTLIIRTNNPSTRQFPGPTVVQPPPRKTLIITDLTYGSTSTTGYHILIPTPQTRIEIY